METSDGSQYKAPWMMEVLEANIKTAGNPTGQVTAGHLLIRGRLIPCSWQYRDSSWHKSPHVCLVLSTDIGAQVLQASAFIDDSEFLEACKVRYPMELFCLPFVTSGSDMEEALEGLVLQTHESSYNSFQRVGYFRTERRSIDCERLRERWKDPLYRDEDYGRERVITLL
jgi:hypothetical protein